MSNKKDRKVAFYVDELIDKLSTVDLLSQMRAYRLKMAGDFRYAKAQKEKGREISARRLHVLMISASAEDLERLALWCEVQAEVLGDAMERASQIGFQ